MSAFLPYDQMVEDAMRSVVRTALKRAQEEGLREGHHFYITFRTDHPGIAMADFLLKQYPREMTIVLQAQFWDLRVAEDHFTVALSFNRMRQGIKVPFAAISSFVDPSVKFGLQFQGPNASLPGRDTALPDSDNTPDEDFVAGAADPAAAATQAAPDGEKIIALDSFRKK